jgi:hypothetical protein
MQELRLWRGGDGAAGATDRVDLIDITGGGGRWVSEMNELIMFSWDGVGTFVMRCQDDGSGVAKVLMCGCPWVVRNERDEG